MSDRKQKYFELNTHFSFLDNEEIRSILSKTKSDGGWGKTQVIEVDAIKVFVKRIPIPKLQEDIFCSKNVYDLPTYYNYGIGSAGFGPARELQTHIKTTNWVLNGELTSFPLLYHYRVMPVQVDEKDIDEEKIEGHISYWVDYWGNNDNIRSYLQDRTNNQLELVLFLEHVPQVLNTWLIEYPDKTPWVLEKMLPTIDFLSSRGVIHFDATLWNILTDGEEVYLADFGLTLDKQFSLTKEEQNFFEANSSYDYGELLMNVMHPFQEIVKALPEEIQESIFEQIGITDSKELTHHEWRTALSKDLEVVCKHDAIEISDEYYNALLKYRKIFRLMSDFFTELRQNKKKDTVFPNGRLKELLVEVGIL